MATFDAAIRKDMERMRNRMLDMEPEVHDDAPTNDSDVKGIRSRVYESDGTRELQIQINGTWYKTTLTAV